MPETKKTFCRFCHVFCGLEVDVQDNRVIDVRGDRDNPVSEGYTCPKGRAEVERINHPERLRTSQKRVGDAFEDIDSGQAIDEIGDKLKQIVAEHGPEAVAVYVGCGGHRSAAGGPWYVAKWLEAMGSPRLYTSLTIDSPSLIIAYDRLFGGPLPLGIFDIDHADSALFVGTNPVVSHQWTMPQSNPMTRMKNALKRGMRLVVIDPRKSDLAERAHVHLQVKPGEDATLLACMIREIIDNDWHDAQYVADYASGFEALYEAVKPFTLEYAEHRTTCPAADIVEAARLFATAGSGAAASGTGLHMARHQNLTTQLVQTLNALCGRFDRRGGMARIAGTQGPALPDSGNEPLPVALRTAQRSRMRDIQGITGLFGYQEMPTNTLTDEILTPGKGQIKALIVNGGNPALVFSDTDHTLKALAELDLLVVNDLFMSATAKHADYVMAVKHPFERVDIPMLSDNYFPFSFSQYTDKLVEAEDDVIEEWDFFWRLGQAIGSGFSLPGIAPDAQPSADDVIRALSPAARVSLDELKAAPPSGQAYDDRIPAVGGVIPDMIGHADRRLAVGHPEVITELAEVLAEPVLDGGAYQPHERFDFRLITYRMPEVYCTTGNNLPSLRRRRQYNPALMNRDDMARLSLSDEDLVTIESAHGRIEAVVEASDSLAPGTVGLAHGWGDPADPRPTREKGSNVQALIPRDVNYDRITGLAQQSAFAVNIVPAAG
ncbi:MAG: oxidoreductase [Halioglobus sp.]|nr:oxidoreductase [Halioglobus sp.]